jgi:type IV pilus assembly protein PilB
MGDKSEYSENAPSDLEFLGGRFYKMPVSALQKILDSDGPGLRLVKEVLLKMLEFPGAGFSVEPFEEYTRVRGKHQGKWRELMRFPAALHKEFSLAVVHLWCGIPDPEMDWRHPFDGLLLLYYPDGKWYDLWVSATPGIHGFILQFTFCARERSFDLDLDKLGFAAADLRALKQAVDAPKGMVLLTGITGSGKSVVCYSSVMRRLRRGDSATAIERPRKFRLPGARQILLKSYVDYHPEFPSALEDDPRVLLVQEIRTYEEVEASLKIARDRLVVAAIHAYEALPCLRRLHDFAGLDYMPQYDRAQIRAFRELLAENLSLVCAGRLVRLLCPSCKAAVEMPVSLLERSGLPIGRKGWVLTFEKGNGCEACRGSGIMKRTGIYEVLPISPAMRRLLAMEVPSCALFRQALEEGLVSLRETALKMVLEGSVSFQEAISATPPRSLEWH